MSGEPQVPESSIAPPEKPFPATQWSVVLAAGRESTPGSDQAIERLCCTYWQPIYAFLRQHHKRHEDAQDATQAFLARFIRKHYFGRAAPERGRFRTFLLTSLKHFLANEWRRTHAIRRGGGTPVLSLDALAEANAAWAEAADPTTPDMAYERRWAATLLDTVLGRLAETYATEGNRDLFEALKHQLWGTADAIPYAELAERTAQTEGALKAAAHRLRQRFRALLREEVGNTVARPEEVEAELRYLIGLLG